MKIFYYLLLLIILFFFFSCSNHYYVDMRYSIDCCERISKFDFGQINYEIDNTSSESIAIIKDDYFDLIITQRFGGLGIHLYNKSKDEVYIDWDNSWLIDDNNMKILFIYSKNEFYNPPFIQKPTVIKEGSNKSLNISLSNHFEYIDENSGRWNYTRLSLKESKLDELNHYHGKVFSIILNLIYKNSSISYLVDFKIDGFELSKNYLIPTVKIDK